MTKRLSPRNQGIGPIPHSTYPVDTWEKLPKGVQYEDLWRIVGGQVEKHILRYPLWKVFVAVYIEGLKHGYDVAQKEEEDS